ncbi:hypothetical protein EDEG_01396 [Edhazardia aedis USNM 41457]|uniref:Glucosamine/galactosamine-6-phosphate isomerase domain-containing protein n=1 Tax=Edhazardia aedis (strain USNM 41457) TaxID=1003232 RepID=J9DSP5_EDHAE|nr:hypothetical protein EDEG_01396 [Edhazardia aedis USNM 41457]|eukprot:EJW04347.1 hypothetical protein EDEG_01396 [Edhazardia aedis USNM 41457]
MFENIRTEHIYYVTKDFYYAFRFFLVKYDGKPANIMLCNGYYLRYFRHEILRSIDKSLWNVYVSDDYMPGYIGAFSYDYINYALRGERHTLHHFLPDMKLPLIHVAILNVEDDGHIASLYPYHRILDSDKEFDIVDEFDYVAAPRLTVTPKKLNEIKELLLLVRPGMYKIEAANKVHPSILDRLHKPAIFIYPAHHYCNNPNDEG